VDRFGAGIEPLSSGRGYQRIELLKNIENSRRSRENDLPIGQWVAALRGSFVFVAANGDRLAFDYGADPDHPGTFTLTPTADGKVVAVFVAEFTPVPEDSTGRFAKVTGGSFTIVATSEPFALTPNAQGFTPPFAYTWAGEGSLEFGRGKK
jgi:hypothetical protein